jgi:hypothetical protein
MLSNQVIACLFVKVTSPQEYASMCTLLDRSTRTIRLSWVGSVNPHTNCSLKIYLSSFAFYNP